MQNLVLLTEKLLMTEYNSGRIIEGRDDFRIIKVESYRICQQLPIETPLSSISNECDFINMT